MRRNWPWVLVVLAVAVVGHFAIVAATPRLVNTVWLTFLNSAGMKANELSNGTRAKLAGRDVVGYDNPDNMSSFLIFDVSKGPVRIHVPVIRDAVYWSICAVDDDTNVFLLLRDRDLTSDDAVVVLVRTGDTYTPLKAEHVAVAPTARGVVLLRTIMRNRYDGKEVARLAAEKAKGYAEIVIAR